MTNEDDSEGERCAPESPISDLEIISRWDSMFVIPRTPLSKKEGRKAPLPLAPPFPTHHNPAPQVSTFSSPLSSQPTIYPTTSLTNPPINNKNAITPPLIPHSLTHRRPRIPNYLAPLALRSN